MTTVDLYRSRTSVLHNLNPLTKVTLTVSAVVAAAMLQDLISVLAVFVFGLIPLAALGKVLPDFLKACLRVIWPFALSLFLIQGFFAPGSTSLITIGPFSLKLEGIWVGALFTARLLVGLGAATLMMLSTRPDKLMLVLVQKGFPSQIAYIVVTALQIIPSFQAKAEAILDAQRSRGLETEGKLIHRLRALLPLVGPLIMGSLMLLEERAIALEARAFNRQGKRTSLQTVSDSKLQIALRWALLAVMIGLVVARLV